MPSFLFDPPVFMKPVFYQLAGFYTGAHYNRYRIGLFKKVHLAGSTEHHSFYELISVIAPFDKA